MLVTPWWMNSPNPRYRSIGAPPMFGVKPRYGLRYGYKRQFFRPYINPNSPTNQATTTNSVPNKTATNVAPNNNKLNASYKPIPPMPRFGFKRYARYARRPLRRWRYGYKPRMWIV